MTQCEHHGRESAQESVQEPRVFTIPASAPFLPTLIEALLQDRLGLGFKPDGDPLSLAAATIYLPTRRACRQAQKIFLEVLKSDAAILPRIVPVGDVDEDELAFAEAASAENADAALELPEALDGLGRVMPLAALILKWAQTIAPRVRGQAPLVANNPATAFALAKDLARLMDDMATRQVDWGELDGLVPDELDKYWELTLDFLQFIRTNWPAILAERRRIEPAERRDLLIAAEAKRLAASKGPVIAAGSTGSIPATATLLATIARLPRGALVLPGLDTDLDDATWRIVASGDATDSAHGHPQFAMAALLTRIGILRDRVPTLGERTAHGRERLTSEALRPAAASELWRDRLRDADFAAHADAAMADIAVIEAANAEEEALAIAVSAARGDGAARQDRGAGDTGPDAGAPGAGGAGAMERAGRRFRRRCARRHAGRSVCAARRGGGAERPAAGADAGAAQASDVPVRCRRGVVAGASGAARAASQDRHRGAGTRAEHVSHRAGHAAPLRSTAVPQRGAA